MTSPDPKPINIVCGACGQQVDVPIMNRATIYLDRGHKGWRYRVAAANGEIIAHSEAYTRRWSAWRALRANVGGPLEVRIFNRSGKTHRTVTVP